MRIYIYTKYMRIYIYTHTQTYAGHTHIIETSKHACIYQDMLLINTAILSKAMGFTGQLVQTGKTKYSSLFP